MITNNQNHSSNNQRQHRLREEPGQPTIMSERQHLLFPAKLYDMLEDGERKSFDHIVSWTPSGTGFKIHNPKAFTQRILPEYFPQQTRYRSFTRQLNLYLFRMLTKDDEIPKDNHWGNEVGCYVHPNFVRGARNKCLHIVRQKKGIESKNCFQAPGAEGTGEQSHNHSNSPCWVHLAAAPETVSRIKERGPRKTGTAATTEDKVAHLSPKTELFASGLKHGGKDGDNDHHQHYVYYSSRRGDIARGDRLALLESPPSSSRLAAETEGKPVCIPPDVTKSSGEQVLHHHSGISYAKTGILGVEGYNNGGDDSNTEGASHIVSYGSNTEDEKQQSESNLTFDTVEALIRNRQEQAPKNLPTSFCPSSCPRRKTTDSSLSTSWFEDQEKLLLDYAREANSYFLHSAQN